MKTDKRKGISLIVLIITIVVIIILATAIIVNLTQINIINNAKEATVKQDIKTLQDELTLYISDKYADKLGKYNIEDLDVTDKTEIAKIMPSIKGTKYEEYIVIEDGKIAIAETMQDPDKTWAMETLGLINTTQNVPREPEVTVTPVIALDTIVETANATITGNDFAYNNPVIPIGFKAIETTGATWNDSNNDGLPDGWNNGLVIQDGNFNQFVWVPCTLDGKNGTIVYTKDFTYKSFYNPSVENTEDDEAALPMKNGTTTVAQTEQITKYEGFYIARYEAGVPANQTKINGTNKNTSNADGIPVVKQGATVWTYIDYDKAKTNAKSFINTANVKSGLITGTAWDSVCKWINSEVDDNGDPIHDIANSIFWGNYSNTDDSAKYGVNTTTQISGTKQTAGKSENWKAKNIYDLAGNTHEWIGEKRKDEEYLDYRIRRGGSFYHDGSKYPASFRGFNDYSNAAVDVTFRLQLYVM